MYVAYRAGDCLIDTTVPELFIHQYRIVGLAADGFRRCPYAAV
jgi:hypothetical protein